MSRSNGSRFALAAATAVAWLQWSAPLPAQVPPQGGGIRGEQLPTPPGGVVIGPQQPPQLDPSVRIIDPNAPREVHPGGDLAFTGLGFNLTVTVPSPFAVALSWDGLRDATGYTVFRDGVAVAELPASPRRYQDTAVQPGGRYKYHVLARMPQPMLKYSRAGQSTAPSAPGTMVIDVSTPQVLAPGGLVAKLVGPDSVEISWQQRPGAAGYSLQWNGQQIGTGPQPRPDSVTQYNVPPGTSRYVLKTVYRKPDGQAVFSDPREVTLRTGPFRVLAIGDSVMWGQGLSDASKFKTKVGQWVGGQLNRAVEVTLLARSGAIVGSNGTSGQAWYAHGEVPASEPFIRYQALTMGPQRVRPENVDLVLVDGCINDVGVKSILSPGMNSGQIAASTMQACGTPVKDMLVGLASTYPNSKIMLTGYFPIVSELSNTADVTLLAMHVGAILVPDPVAIGIATLHLRQHWIANSNTFHAVSTSQLMTAATQAGVESGGGNRIEFVPVPFGMQNAFAAPDSLLWRVPVPPSPRDEAYAERFEACRPVPPGVENVTCVAASMGHPNVRGAQVYADSITSRLGKFLPEWRARFASMQSAP